MNNDLVSRSLKILDEGKMSAFSSDKQRRKVFALLRRGMSVYPQGSYSAGSFFQRIKGEKPVDVPGQQRKKRPTIGLDFLGYETGGKPGAKVLEAGKVRGVVQPERFLSKIQKVRNVKGAPENLKPHVIKLENTFLKMHVRAVQSETTPEKFSWKDVRNVRQIIPEFREQGWRVVKEEPGMSFHYTVLEKRGTRIMAVVQRKDVKKLSQPIDPYVQILTKDTPDVGVFRGFVSSHGDVPQNQIRRIVSSAKSATRKQYRLPDLKMYSKMKDRSSVNVGSSEG